MSTARDRIDPASRAGLDAAARTLPGDPNAIGDIGARRDTARRLLEQAAPPVVSGVDVDATTVPGLAGDPEVPVRVYRPQDAGPELPAVLHIHGGGMCLGSLDEDDADARLLSRQVQAVVVSVGYRLAPEHPYPAGLRDCTAALHWLAGQAPRLGVDPARMAVHGASAGGGLALATSLWARDHGAPPICFVMAIYPMLDHRNTTPSSYEVVDVGIWDRATNIEAWQWYLAGQPPDDYSSPAQAADLTSLPPTFVDVGTVDLFRDEDIAFAQRLMQAGVPCELHVHPGAFHVSEGLAPDAPLSRRIRQLRLAALRRALHPGRPEDA